MNKNINRNREVYINGNNAVQLEGLYSNYKTGPKPDEKVRKNKAKASRGQSTNPIYTFILSSVIITTLIITVILLKTQFIVTDHSEKLIDLQQELVEIKKTNDQIESDIQKSVNMDEVYRIATEELGMVQAGKEDIKYVPEKDLTYTVQYADVDVPNDEAGVNIGNILGFISKGW